MLMRLVGQIDRLSTWLGQLFGWLMIPLMMLIVWEVVGRYFFRVSNAWAFDVQIMLYGTVFMMAGAYTLAKSGHVRGDILYGFLQPRTQATIDLMLYVLFFLPGVVALVYAGLSFANDSFLIDERSSVTAGGPPLWPFKFIIPLSGAILLLQGLAEIARCILCIKTGEWPARGQDVEEVDVDKLRAQISTVPAAESEKRA